jgi:probable dihydroxyacetone kinase regulator
MTPVSVLTKKALLAAFGDLLEKKPFNKITVTDITERCGVNRMTFYYHFQDIYELMIWGLETHVLNVDKSCTTYANWQEGYLKIYRFALEHRLYITKIFQTMRQENLEHHLHRIVRNMVLTVMDDRSSDRALSQEDRDFVAQTCSYILVGTMVDWVNRGMKESPELMVKRVGCLMNGMIDRAVREFDPA